MKSYKDEILDQQYYAKVEVEKLEWEIKWRERRLAQIRHTVDNAEAWLECDKTGHQFTSWKHHPAYCVTCGFYPFGDD